MAPQKNYNKQISIIVPMYCETDNVDLFLTTLLKTIETQPYVFEIIVVDDGSTDDTFAKLKNWTERDSRVNALSLSKNYGHQIALLAGLDQARGDAVITMDADLQHPPSYIATMLEKWNHGYDVVNMVKMKTEDRGFIKVFFAGTFYAFFNRISSVKIHANASDFRLIDQKVLQVVREYRQRQFFLRGIISEIGFKTTYCPYDAPARLHGSARYTLMKLFDLALRGVFSYSNLALKIPLYFGLLMVLLSFLNIGWGLAKLALGIALPEGWLSTFSLIAMLSSLIFLFLGFQGVYIARIYDEVRERPLYSLKAVIKKAAG